MPNFSGTPATVVWTGGTATFSPPRFSGSAAQVRWTGGSASWTVGSDPTTTTTVPELDRLTSFDQLFNKDGTPSLRMISIWQDMCEKIEEAFTAVSGDIDDLASIVARLTAAEAVAAAANDNATTAVDTVTIANSYTDPTSVLTAANTGVVTIAAHTRVYGDGSSVSVNSGSVSGFASGDQVAVYYQDAGRAGGAVTYYGTTDAVAQSGATHTLGVVTIPAAGAASTTGTGVTAPGVPSGVYTVPKDYFSTL